MWGLGVSTCIVCGEPGGADRRLFRASHVPDIFLHEECIDWRESFADVLSDLERTAA